MIEVGRPLPIKDAFKSFVFLHLFVHISHLRTLKNEKQKATQEGLCTH